ncbi:hypothetical protein AO263_32850 [Pseudomonas sp. NZIPFR-PS5]|nr:hypothetical protein AO263_32850 [Pseudomonas sp. NZIPFR-PS5]
MRRLFPYSLLGCTLAAVLAGCSSTPNNPSFNFDTAKTPSDYAKCIYPKWQQILPVSARAVVVGFRPQCPGNRSPRLPVMMEGIVVRRFVALHCSPHPRSGCSA